MSKRYTTESSDRFCIHWIYEDGVGIARAETAETAERIAAALNRLAPDRRRVIEAVRDAYLSATNATGGLMLSEDYAVVADAAIDAARGEAVAWAIDTDTPLAPGEAFAWHPTMLHKTPSFAAPPAAAVPAEDAIEAAYWDFDARHKGYGPHKTTPQSERDAFKWAVRDMLAAVRKGGES